MNQTKKVLNISWQRLILEGDTCPRCGSTEKELEQALIELKKQLEPKEIEVILKKSKLTSEEFKENPLESNRILFNGKSLESLLNAQAGQSLCCDACGDSQCRTLEFKGKTHEVITTKMIVEAGLKAIKLDSTRGF